MQIELPEAVVVSLDQIKPYDNNPRRISPEAIAAVKKSISDYGYVQPIAVQKSTMEIVVGHTRYRALKELGVKEVQIYLLDLTDEKARQYRLVDNRTNELSEWDHKSLVLELREWDEQLLESYFPDVDLEIGMITDEDLTQDEIDKAASKATTIREAPVVPVTKVTCPSCFHKFDVKSASLPGLSVADLDLLTSRSQE